MSPAPAAPIKTAPLDAARTARLMAVVNPKLLAAGRRPVDDAVAEFVYEGNDPVGFLITSPADARVLTLGWCADELSEY